VVDNTNQEHLDPTDELTLETVKSRAVKGVVVLAGRTFILNIISLFATGLLTYFLSPENFGVFWIVSAVVNFLYYFGDIGLAAALIQKKEKIEKQDLATTFTIQQAMVVTLILIVFLLSPYLSRVYGLNSDGKLLLYALSFSLFLSSLKTIPSVLLERDLEFGKLVIPQVLENLVYNLVAVFFAWRGFGISSFTYAVLLRGIVGLVAIYVIKPWVPKIAISKESLKKLLKFGLPYQANTLLATIKDDGLTAFLGGVLGAGGIGYLGWAQKWGQAPLRFFMDHVIKVTFPAFSRLQENRSELKRTLERSVFFITFLVFPSVVGLVILAPLLVRIIPKYEKWEPALIPLTIISLNTVLASVTTQLTNILNSIGKIKITFRLMIMWTILSWVLIPFLSIKYGVIGAAVGYTLVGSSSLIAIYVVRRIIKFSLVSSILPSAISVAFMGVALKLLSILLPENIYMVAVMIVLGLGVHLIVTYLIIGSSFKNDVVKSLGLLIRRK